MIPAVEAARNRQWARRCRRLREKFHQITRANPGADWFPIASRSRVLMPGERRVPAGSYIDQTVIYPEE